jgi:hypothetical protein
VQLSQLACELFREIDFQPVENSENKNSLYHVFSQPNPRALVGLAAKFMQSTEFSSAQANEMVAQINVPKLVRALKRVNSTGIGLFGAGRY